MTINQAEVIIAAFERQRARCEKQLAQLPDAQREMTEYTEKELAAASVLAVESEIEAWKKAAAIVRRATPTKNIQDIGRPITRAEAIATACEISRAAEQARRDAE